MEPTRPQGPRSGRAFSRRSLVLSAPVLATGVWAGRPARLARAATQDATSQRLTERWEHYRGTLGGVWEVWRGDKASHNVTWAPVSLPHCYNARDAVDPELSYYQGPGWYRTHFQAAAPAEGRTLLHFEGAGQQSTVYVGSEKVGGHVGGYDAFTIDVTDAVARFRKGADPKTPVPLAVECDNSRDLERIPSALSDFFLYGGLYRHVDVFTVPAVSVYRLLIDATLTESGTGQATLSARLWNPTRARGPVDIALSIRDGRGRTVYETTRKSVPWTGTQRLAEVTLPEVAAWSPDRPALYTCVLTLSSAHGRMTVSERFGFRRFHFEKQGPFFLNGERLLLKGTHRHEDHAGLGAAMSDALIRKEMQMIKDLGANFIRLGHYQQSPLVLDLCDEIGLLVWEEIPWCRGGLGGERYKRQAREMLTAMIDQHRNHPSVILWGLGNENDWPGDFPTFDKEAIRGFMRELHQLSHKLDPSRKTAIRRCDFCKDIVDVYSPSIWAGWYRGQYTEYKSASEKEMKTVNHFLHVEWGGDSHARRHAEDPDRILSRIAAGQGTDERGMDYLLTGGQARANKDGDWSETYICNLFDWHLKEQETMPWLSGTAQWVFKDFATPLRPDNPVPYVNQKGLVERDLTPKEGYYVFQSYWAKKPMIHIYGHGFPIRWGEEGEQKLIKVYSNCPEVELFVNGRSLGRRQRKSQDFPAAGLRWMAPLRKGRNEVRAVGFTGKSRINDELRFQYQTDKWAAPARLALETLKDAGRISTVGVRLLDAKGVLCLDARNVVRFDLAGDGRLLDNLGTSLGARVVQLANGQGAISVELGRDPAVISVASEGLPTALLTLNPRRLAQGI